LASEESQQVGAKGSNKRVRRRRIGRPITLAQTVQVPGGLARPDALLEADFHL
jgi:hypothetical protein